MQQWRINLVLAILVLFGGGVILRLAFLQIIDFGFYKALAQGQQNLSFLDIGERGTIFLKDKLGTLYTLATNQDFALVFLTPIEVKDKEMTAQKLAEIMQLSKADILSRLEKKESFYEVLKKRISEEEKEALAKENLPGVHIAKENVRYYPQETMAGQVVGFVNRNGKGQYGVEEIYQDTFQGKEGLK